MLKPEIFSTVFSKILSHSTANLSTALTQKISLNFTTFFPPYVY